MCADKSTEEPSLCVREALVKQVLQKELQASSPNVADGGHADEADLCALQLCFFRRGQVVVGNPMTFAFLSESR